MATFLYNPDRKSRNELIAEFVIRTDVYNEIMHDLETSAMKGPEQNYMLVGQRGAGKTTLLNRLKYGIEDNDILQKKLIPILFSEEQYNISELVNIWENVAQNLEDYYGFEGLYREMEPHLSKENAEELCYDIIVESLKKKKKNLVLLIDNIGDMLKKLEKVEIHRLREILQTGSEIRLIVGSPFYPDTLLDYHQPFFEFFKVVRLDGLSNSETILLLLKLAEINKEEEKITKIIKETPGRIETLRTLTGGVVRTIVLMFNIFIEFNNEDAVADLEKILDAVTPLYKHRMDDLPVQQQKIVDAVAKNWDGISVKELKDRVRIEGKIISAQLRQLEKNQVIQIVGTGTKNHIYFLKERFFNIWYLMRYGRKYDRQRVIWLVKFLESWCSGIEIEKRIIDFVQKIKMGEMGENLINFYGEVYTTFENICSETKILLKESTPKYLANKINIENSELLRMAEEELEKVNYQKAFDLFNLLHNPSEAECLKIVRHLFILMKKYSNFHKESWNNILKKTEAKDVSFNVFSKYEQLSLMSILIHDSVSVLMFKEYELAHRAYNIFFEMINRSTGLPDGVLNFLMDIMLQQFLRFSQSNLVLSTFENYPEWKDKLKPIYYATLKLMDRENELLKIASDIKEKVEEIVDQINDAGKELELDYSK